MVAAVLDEYGTAPRYAARSDANAKAWFGYADFEEPCKVGVAVSRSPVGPFRTRGASSHRRRLSR